MWIYGLNICHLLLQQDAQYLIMAKSFQRAWTRFVELYHLLRGHCVVQQMEGPVERADMAIMSKFETR